MIHCPVPENEMGYIFTIYHSNTYCSPKYNAFVSNLGFCYEGVCPNNI